MNAESPVQPLTLIGEQGFTPAVKLFESVRREIEGRCRQQLAKVERAEQEVSRLLTSLDRSMIDVQVTIGRKGIRNRKPISDLEVVRTAVSTFCDEKFTLSELVDRVASNSPGHSMSRTVVSRRLHDLKRKGTVIVVLDETADPVFLKKRYYRTRRRCPDGPPAVEPPAGGPKKEET